MAFDASGELLLSGGGDGTARLWRLPGGEVVGEFTHSPSWIRAVALNASATTLALGCGPGDIYVHDVSSGQAIAELHGHKGRVLMIGFTADPQALVSAAAGGTVRSWSLTSHKQLAQVRVDASLQTAALDAHNRIVLAAGAAGSIAIEIPTVSDTE